MTEFVEIVIIKSKRFALTGIKKLVFTPKTMHQMILGTNGSGKSSLISEISPLPSNLSEDYNKGGGKKVTIRHNSLTYIVQSGIELGTNHSFLINGRELNDGGTSKIQLKLVEEHFNITPKIHKLLIGEDMFTEMTANERKAWLTTLDKVDYEFALNEFNKHKTHLRDLKGALKFAVESLATTKVEANTIPLEDLEAERGQLSTQLLHISDRSKELNELEFKSGVDSSMANAVTRLKEFRNMIDYENTSIKKVTDMIVVNQRTIVKTTNTLSKLEDRINQMPIFDSGEQVKVESDLHVCYSDIENLNKYNVFHVPIIELLALLPKILSKAETAMELVEAIRSIRYTNEDVIKSLTVKLNKFTEEHNEKSIRSTQLTTLIEHLDSHGDDSLTCPKCDNHFKTSETVDINELKTEKHNLESRLLDLSNAMMNLETNLQSDAKRKSLIEELSSVLLDPMTKDIIYIGFTNFEYNMNDNLLPINDMFNFIINNIRNLKPYPELKAHKEELTMKLSLIKKNNIVLEEKGISEDVYNQLITDKVRIQQDLQTLEESISSHKESLAILNNIQREARLFKQGHKDAFSNFLFKMGQQELEVLKSLKYEKNIRVSELDEIISKATETNNKIELYKKQINDYTEEMLIVSTIIDTLSPNKGLIGEAITAFLNSFLEDINKIIGYMWSYSLRVNPCEVSSNGNLDYKFPIEVNGLKTVKDVKQGSRSMKEIINLGFVLIAMKHLGLSEYPIYLDEFASSMDKGHHEKGFDLLNKVVEQHPQVFMISHFLEFYGGIANMDISVLSTQNLSLDDDMEYNKVMKLTLG